MVSLVKHDLEFILKQIKIAEAHAAGGDLATLVVEAGGIDPAAQGTPAQAHLLPYGLRTVDGSYNNLIAGREMWGAADQPFPQATDPYYRNEGDDTFPYVPGNNNNYENSGSVADADPRIISNLIVDQTSNNPAAKAHYEKLIAEGKEVPTTPLTDINGNLVLDANGEQVVIYTFENVAPDIGDSAPYNSMFTLFGQFFDHGLDLVAKGGNGTVYIPLQPDDPLYNPNSPQTNFMVLTRLTPGGTNTTTPWVDQNQTYTSHASHQVFLREYALDAEGRPVATGKLLEGDRGLATWADVKEQARAMLGIELTDADVGRVPLLRTDPYGKFIPDPVTGFAQVVVGIGADGIPNTADDIVISGTPDAPVSLTNAVRIGHAFLDDIAHNAVPVAVDGALVPDADSDANNPIPMDQQGNKLAYDNELLDAHYVTGDGRGNENIGLTSIHHVFHSEHNHIVEQVKQVVLATNDPDFIKQWLIEGANATDGVQDGEWNGERLFQAARFTTEMQYQHLVFEEFARKIQPDVDAFVFEPSADINPAIFAEFAHVVYRFGHSMLNETIDRIDANGNSDNMTLFDGFLNPLALGAVDADGNVIIDHDTAAGAIIRGMSRQTGNEIDEFTTNVLRNQLTGIPLDLAALNIARARDAGVPPLNVARAQFYELAGQDTQLKPYTSWVDYALNLKNPASIVNFIAAYGMHQSITSATTIDGKRAAAAALVMGGEGAPADRLDFLNSTGAWANQETGLNLIDLWVGGLAEKKMDFGGMLGSTFSFIFEMQLENLQDGDRFYYLSRVQGLNLLNELENNSLSEIIMRNTDLGDAGSTALPGDIFATPDHTLEMDLSKQIGTDPAHADPILNALTPMVVRQDIDGDGDGDVLIYNGTDHVVMGGSEEADLMAGGEGDDTLWGRGGNDTIEAGYGVDIVHGGDGDDIITNAGTDIGQTDFLHGEAGNDVIQGGSGLALIFGNQGQDFIVTGPDGKEAMGGTGNDFMLGGDGGDLLLGNEGDDWMEGGPRFDTLAGENSELMFNSTIIGHDVLNGGGSDTDYDAESGDDIMFQGEGIQRSNGMAGFDWAVHKGDTVAANSNLGIPIFDNQEAFILRDRFDLVEGLSGWKFDDVLTGRVAAVNTRAEATGTAAIPAPGSSLESYSNALLEKNVALIDGLAQLVAHLERTTVVGLDGKSEVVVMDTADASDILLGGGGSDTIKGFAGNDIIDGDKWLNARIRITVGNETYTADGMTGKVYREADYVDGAPVDGAVAQFGGQTLDTLMFNATLNPGQLSIVREIVDGDADNSDVDVAVYGDLRANYVITSNADGSITVEHVNVTVETDPTTGNNRISDGTDRLFNIETLRFADEEITVSPPNLSLHAFDGARVLDQFSQGSYANSNGNTPWATSWQESSEPTGGNITTSGAIRITGGELRFGESGGDGATIQRGLNLAGATTARLSYSVDEQGLDFNQGEQVTVFFSADGVTFTLIDTINQNTNNANRSIDLTGPFTANAAIRFVTTAMSAANEFVYIDNVAVDFTTPAAAPSVNYETTFTEDGNSVAIASLPGIVDNDAQMTSARIVLTNAQANDVLNVTGLGGTGISASVDTSVAGQITLNLTGAASLAAYQRAIQGVTFNNTSENPSTVDRIIHVTVNDGVFDSNVATTTVNVVAVNDQPSANNDSIITNVVNAPIVIPEWALLANDTDAEGATLDITAVSGVNGLTNVSLTANPGSVTLTDSGTGGGSFTYTASDGSSSNGTDTAQVTVIRETGTIDGTTGANIIVGDDAASTIDGGLGNDTIFAGGGNDTIVWNGNIFGTDGRDYMDGGTGVDTFDLNGSAFASETFGVYTRDAAIAAGMAGLQATTEIVITRTVGGTTAIVGELDNIEEIVIGTRDVATPGGPSGGSAGGNDTVAIFGDFTGTSLNLNTITVNGTVDDDTVDISQLTSAHRIVFRSRGGHDTIIGTLRPQDVIELEPGRVLDEYTRTENEDGTTTLSCDTHSVTFQSECMPTIREIPAPVNPDPVSPDPVNPDPGTPVPVAPTDLILRGGSRNDKLYGQDGNDRLYGGNGHDRLIGGDGDDRMWGGKGHDIYRVDSRGDRVFEARGSGSDTVISSVSHTLGANVERLILAGLEDLSGFGNGLGNRLTGNAGDNLLMGRGGNDILKGGAGEDVLKGGVGRDSLYGGSGEDHLAGGADDGDRLTGGSGEDTFLFQKGMGRDFVTDFRNGQDRIDVSSLDQVCKASDLTMIQVGDDVEIHHGTDVLVLEGVSIAQLDQKDFVF